MKEEVEGTETEPIQTTEAMSPNKLRKTIILSTVFLLLTIIFFSALGIFAILGNRASSDFPIDRPIVISPGTDVRAIAETLAEEKVVRSAALLYYMILLFHDPTTVKASTYIFTEPITTFEVAKKLSEGDFDADLVRLTHYEGERISKLAERAAEVLPDFDVQRFNENAATYEGKLYPETYLIPPTFTDEDLLALLLNAYEETIEPVRPKIDESGLTEDEVLTLASIVEREANSSTSKKMVAVILLNRLEIGMALQSDATIEYVLDTPISELRAGELAGHLDEVDSLYNTYKYPGLPPTPIGNPGIESILAVLEPTPSEYFYYITGDDGNFYYSRTYDEHLDNIQKYLK